MSAPPLYASSTAIDTEKGLKPKCHCRCYDPRAGANIKSDVSAEVFVFGLADPKDPAKGVVTENYVMRRVRNYGYHSHLLTSIIAACFLLIGFAMYYQLCMLEDFLQGHGGKGLRQRVSMDPATAAGVMQGLAVVLGGVMSVNVRVGGEAMPTWGRIMAVWLLPSLFLLAVITVALVGVLEFWPRM